jgi:hypothetical protein
MSVLDNARREKFAQEVASGKSLTDAYEAAGYKPNRKNAQRLKTVVSARITELQAQGAERAVVTLESLIAEAGELQEKAAGHNQYSAAISALIAKAKLSGHWVEKRQHLYKKRGLKELSFEELVHIAAGGEPPDDVADLEAEWKAMRLENASR